MMHKLWISLLIFLKILTFIRGYPDGAPERACFIMVPRHTHPHSRRPILKQLGHSPYNITLSAGAYRSDRPLRVTIAGAPFKGFMLTACEDGLMDWPTGTFYSDSPDARPLWCVDRNDAVTHNNSNWKSSVTVLWYGPRFTSADHIIFTATVVTNRTTYWTNIKSNMIMQDPAQNAGAGGGEAPEGGLGAGLVPGVDAWGYPTTPAWSWGGGGGGGGRGGGGGGGGWGTGNGGGGGGGGQGESATGESTTPSSWNSGRQWNQWGLNSMGGGGWTTTQAPTRSNMWGANPFGGGGGNNNWGNNGGGNPWGNSGSSGTGGGSGSNAGGNPWGNSGGGGSNANPNWGNGSNGGGGGGGGNNWGNGGGSGGTGTTGATNNWGNGGGSGGGGGKGSGGGGGNNWGNNKPGGSNSGGGGGNRNSNTGRGGNQFGLNNWQLQLMRQLLGLKR